MKNHDLLWSPNDSTGFRLRNPRELINLLINKSIYSVQTSASSNANVQKLNAVDVNSYLINRHWFKGSWWFVGSLQNFLKVFSLEAPEWDNGSRLSFEEEKKNRAIRRARDRRGREAPFRRWCVTFACTDMTKPLGLPRASNCRTSFFL